jgi:hypothetical protein
MFDCCSRNQSVCCVRGVPVACRAATIAPQSSAIAIVTGRIRPPNCTSTPCSSHRMSLDRRTSSFCSTMPLRNSPMVITLKKSEVLGWAKTQASTPGSGRVRCSSDGMFVSRRKPLTDQPGVPSKGSLCSRHHLRALEWSQTAPLARFPQVAARPSIPARAHSATHPAARLRHWQTLQLAAAVESAPPSRDVVSRWSCITACIKYRNFAATVSTAQAQ